MMLAPGASVHSVRPLKWLVDLGCVVLFIDATRPSLDSEGRFSYAGYPLSDRRLRWFGWRLAHRIALVQLRWLRRRFRADIVHVHWVDRRAQACAAAGLRPLVLTVWGSDVNVMMSAESDLMDRRAVIDSLRAADLVIVDSPDMPAKCELLAGRKLRTALLPLGIDTSRFKPASGATVREWRARLAIPDGVTVLMSARAWGPIYGHEQILEAFHLAQSMTANPMVLLFKVYNTSNYPQAEALEAALRDRVEQLGLGSKVRWLPQVSREDLPLTYSLADVVLNYPSMDAFPVTFIEATACQCPVITIDLPAYRGTFVHDFCRLVPAGDVNALAQAMREHAESDLPTTRAALTPARELMVRDFDEKVTAARLMELYRDVLSRHRSAAGGPPSSG